MTMHRSEVVGLTGEAEWLLSFQEHGSVTYKHSLGLKFGSLVHTLSGDYCIIEVHLHSLLKRWNEKMWRSPQVMFIAPHPSFGPLMCVCFVMQFSERSTTHVSSLLDTEQLCLLFWDTAETSRFCPTLRAFGGSWKHCRGNPGLWVGPCGFRLWAFLPVCSCIDFLCNQDPQVRVQQPNASPLRTSWGPCGGSGHSFSLVQKASLKTDMAISPSNSSWLLSSLVIKLHSKAWAVKDGVGVGRFDFLIRGIFCRLEEWDLHSWNPPGPHFCPYKRNNSHGQEVPQGPISSPGRKEGIVCSLLLFLYIPLPKTSDVSGLFFKLLSPGLEQKCNCEV